VRKNPVILLLLAAAMLIPCSAVLAGTIDGNWEIASGNREIIVANVTTKSIIDISYVPKPPVFTIYIDRTPEGPFIAIVNGGEGVDFLWEVTQQDPTYAQDTLKNIENLVRRNDRHFEYKVTDPDNNKSSTVSLKLSGDGNTLIYEKREINESDKESVTINFRRVGAPPAISGFWRAAEGSFIQGLEGPERVTGIISNVQPLTFSIRLEEPFADTYSIRINGEDGLTFDKVSNGSIIENVSIGGSFENLKKRGDAVYRSFVDNNAETLEVTFTLVSESEIGFIWEKIKSADNEVSGYEKIVITSRRETSGGGGGGGGGGGCDAGLGALVLALILPAIKITRRKK